MKPDLFAVTSYDGYEDRWFIEMDLGSESMPQVLEKCNGYLRYYYTGLEQKATEMFPLVVWIVKDSQRKENLKACIRENLQGHPKMFLVITPDELHYWVKSYDEPSKVFGIDGGRISKLSLKQNGEYVANYDRGWDKRPATPEAEAAYAILLKEYN